MNSPKHRGNKLQGLHKAAKFLPWLPALGGLKAMVCVCIAFVKGLTAAGVEEVVPRLSLAVCVCRRKSGARLPGRTGFSSEGVHAQSSS